MKKSIIAIIIVLCTLFTACSDSKTLNPEKKAENKAQITKEVLQMKHYKKDIDGVIFDTEIFIDKNVTEDSIINATVSLNTLDIEKFKSTFIGDKKIVNTETMFGTTPAGPKATFTYLKGDNWQASYCDKNTNITFTNGNFDQYVSSCIYLDPIFPSYNADKYSLKDNLPFATREDAFKDIKTTLLSVGMDIGDNYKAYAMGHKTMKQEEYATDSEGNEDKRYYKPIWSQDDDCYYFLVRPQVNNIPTFFKFNVSPPTYLQDKDCTNIIVYNKHGIQSIKSHELFLLNKDVKKVDLISFDKIAQTVALPYSNILGDNTYKISKATLAYKVDGSVMSDKYPLTPVWVVEIQEPISESPNILKEIIIDATTGEVLFNGK